MNEEEQERALDLINKLQHKLLKNGHKDIFMSLMEIKYEIRSDEYRFDKVEDNSFKQGYIDYEFDITKGIKNKPKPMKVNKEVGF